MHVAARLFPGYWRVPLDAQKPERHPGIFELRQSGLEDIQYTWGHALEKITSWLDSWLLMGGLLETSVHEEATAAHCHLRRVIHFFKISLIIL